VYAEASLALCERIAVAGMRVVCSNASVDGDAMSCWEPSLANWKWVLDVNRRGVLRGIRLCSHLRTGARVLAPRAAEPIGPRALDVPDAHPSTGRFSARQHRPVLEWPATLARDARSGSAHHEMHLAVQFADALPGPTPAPAASCQPFTLLNVTEQLPVSVSLPIASSSTLTRKQMRVAEVEPPASDVTTGAPGPATLAVSSASTLIVTAPS
jgi:hypothetical protein